jgi:methylglutaconyl-CoA hydratase
MNKHDVVQFKLEAGVATLTLNRPEVRNAFDDRMIAALTEHLHQLQQNDQVYAVVLRGEGGHFSAGADIQWMQKTLLYSKEENQRDALALASLLHTFNHLNKPTIAVVQGSVFGGAVGLVACADITIAAPEAIFCLSEVRLGLVPAVIGPYVITAMGPRAARRYMLTAETFLAEEAHFLGLVHEVIPSPSLDKHVASFLYALKHNGPRAIPIAKNMIHTLTEESFPTLAQMEYTANLIAELRVSEEAQEGLNAFLEKRAAKWQTD